MHPLLPLLYTITTALAADPDPNNVFIKPKPATNGLQPSGETFPQGTNLDVQYKTTFTNAHLSFFCGNSYNGNIPLSFLPLSLFLNLPSPVGLLSPSSLAYVATPLPPPPLLLLVTTLPNIHPPPLPFSSLTPLSNNQRPNPLLFLPRQDRHRTL